MRLTWIILVSLLVLMGCGSPSVNESTVTEVITGTKPVPLPLTPAINDDPPENFVGIEAISIMPQDELLLKQDQLKGLFLSVTLNNGEVFTHLTHELLSDYPEVNGNIIWYSNNPNIVTINKKGRLKAIGIGKTTILASLQNRATFITVEVVNETQASEAPPPAMPPVTPPDDDSPPDENIPDPPDPVSPEPPDDASDYFLNDNDVFFPNLGTGGEVDPDVFPDILLGIPSGVYDVLSLGAQGELKIELNGYVIVDGPGADFTIFENPFPGWAECAEVSISEDDQIYETFSCTQFDPAEIYPGCAGVRPVSYGLDEQDYLNPQISGGDSFDLSTLPDLSSTFVKFIKIRDLGLCVPSPDDSPAGIIMNGFDLDAMAIINGVNEQDF